MSKLLILFPFLLVFTCALFAVNFAYAQQDVGSEVLEFFEEKPVSKQGAKIVPPKELYEEKLKLSDIPDSYIERAMAYEARCSGDWEMARFYSCQCLSIKYLDRLIEQEGQIREDLFMLDMRTECKDGKNMAGLMYNECLSGGMSYPLNVDPKTFCECIANTYASAYERSSLAPTARTHGALRTRSVIACKNPALARQLFPGSVGF